MKKILFFDIETVPLCKWDELDEGLKGVWVDKHHFKNLEAEINFREKEIEKAKILNKEHTSFSTPTIEQIWNKYSPLHAEFGKILCISLGIVKDDGSVKISTLSGDEKTVIQKFIDFLFKHSYTLCGFNIKSFDIPFFVKRAWHHKVKVFPEQLQLIGKKPWEIKSIDLMEDYKGTSWANTSLDLICKHLGIQTPKTVFQNYEVSTLYMEGKIKEEEIISYCERDITATIDLFFILN